MHLISTTYRIVPLRHQVMIGEQPQMVMDTYYHDDAYSRWIQWRNQKAKDADLHKQAVSNRRAGGYEDPVVKGVGGMPSYTHQLNTMVEFLDRKTLLPAIFFVFSRNKCEEYAKLISKNLLTSSESASIKHIWNFHLHGQKELLETMPQAHTLLSLLEKGIAFHHSGLVPILREIVEILFGKGLIKLLFATETFAVGINMPTKTVVFTDLEKYTNEGRRLLTTDEYLQMAGRAGRRGKDTEGHVFYLPCRDPVASGDIKRMMTGVLSPITSRMDFHYDFLLKALQNPHVNYEDILEKSYWMEQTRVQIAARETEMETLKQKNKELGITEEELLQLFEWEKLKNEVQSSVNAKRKKATKLLSEWEDNHSGPNWNRLRMLYTTWKKNDTEIFQLSEDVRQLSQSSKNVQKKIDFLSEAGYLEDGNPSLTGILATEANEANGLLLTTAMMLKESNDLDCEELICLLAGFLGESEKGVEGARLDTLHLSDRVEAILYSVDDWAEELVKLESRHGCESPPSYWKLQSSWIDIARRWYTGEDASAICMEYGIYEGNFIRAMLKLSNILEEWMNMLTYLKRTDQLERYKDLKECILRGVVKPQSLYLTL
jgi:superfamily II RNA helicase